MRRFHSIYHDLQYQFVQELVMFIYLTLDFKRV